MQSNVAAAAFAETESNRQIETDINCKRATSFLHHISKGGAFEYLKRSGQNKSFQQRPIV